MTAAEALAERKLVHGILQPWMSISHTGMRARRTADACAAGDIEALWKWLIANRWSNPGAVDAAAPPAADDDGGDRAREAERAIARQASTAGGTARSALVQCSYGADDA